MTTRRRRHTPPQHPARATLLGVVRPIARVLVAIVGGILVIAVGIWISDALPTPQVRAPVHRFVIENRTDLLLSRIELTDRSGGGLDTPIVMATTSDLASGERWSINFALGETRAVGLNVDEFGKRYEFRHIALMRADLGDVHVLTILPGPHVNGRSADVTFTIADR